MALNNIDSMMMNIVTRIIYMKYSKLKCKWVGTSLRGKLSHYLNVSTGNYYNNYFKLPAQLRF